MKRKKINWLEIVATGLAALGSLAIVGFIYAFVCAALLYLKVA